MSNLEVRIITLETIRIASAHGFGDSPEMQAWDKIQSWARSKGLLQDRSALRFFGFNNPNPAPGSPNYGYDQWITVGPDVQADGEIKVFDFEGGLYAVAHCESLEVIGEVWQQLVAWCEDSLYKMAHHQCLEEFLSPLENLEHSANCVFDLYLPIAE